MRCDPNADTRKFPIEEYFSKEPNAWVCECGAVNFLEDRLCEVCEGDIEKVILYKLHIKNFEK